MATVEASAKFSGKSWGGTCRLTYTSGNGELTITGLAFKANPANSTTAGYGASYENAQSVTFYAGGQSITRNIGNVKINSTSYQAAGDSYGSTSLTPIYFSGLNGSTAVSFTCRARSSSPYNLTFDFTIDAGSPPPVINYYSVVGYVRNQNADGSYGGYWTWINESGVQEGTYKSYSGYASDATYDPISWSGYINSNTTFYLDANRHVYWNDINAYKPDGSTQNGLMFNVSTSDGGSWTNLTNEPSSFSKRVGVTATVSNIRSNVTGTHYTTNSVTGTGASSFTWTFNTANYVVHMYSAWNTYNINYVLLGGSVATQPTSATYESTFNVSHATKTYTIIGNANGTGLTVGSNTTTSVPFDGWFSNDVNDSTAMAGNSASSLVSWPSMSTPATYSYFKNLTPTDGGTVTLYAQWLQATATLPTLSSVTGYTSYWCSDQAGEDIIGTSGSTFGMSGGLTTLTKTVYAKLVVNTYTIEYSANGGDTAPASQTKTYGTPLTLSSVRPTKSGLRFVEWNTQSDGSGTSYQPGDTLNTDLSTVNNDTVYLYAQWVPSNTTLKVVDSQGNVITAPVLIINSDGSTIDPLQIRII